jgi:hypothetical protein
LGEPSSLTVARPRPLFHFLLDFDSLELAGRAWASFCNFKSLFLCSNPVFGFNFLQKWLGFKQTKKN